MAEFSVECTDWLRGVGALAAASIDLLYVDPPFNTGRTQTTPPSAGRRRSDIGTTTAAFADRFGSTDAFIAWLRDRVHATLPALKASANILIHTDWRTHHRVRVMLDDLLGADRFVNHIVWAYGLGGSSPRSFARKHDDIAAYCIDPALAYFDPPRVPATSNRLKGRTKKATDVLDIPAINNMARERTGYPTQKPLALMTMLVGAFSPPGGTVLDPCCGSGTTLAAAKSLGRSAIGFDANADAAKLSLRRLGQTP